MEPDKELLISKVFLKRLICDKGLPGHSNRGMVDKAWKKIAADMNIEDDKILRKKWKYLRDQFAVEMGKISNSHSGEHGINLEAKWPFFRSMMFLVGIVKPRPISSKTYQASPQSTYLDEEPSELVSQPEVESVEAVKVECVECFESCQKGSVGDTFGLVQKKPRNGSHNQQTLRRESTETSLAESVVRDRYEDCDDELFFRSLIPFVWKIPFHLKLRLRTRVIELIEDFTTPNIRNISSPSSSFSGPSSLYEPSGI